MDAVGFNTNFAWVSGVPSSDSRNDSNDKDVSYEVVDGVACTGLKYALSVAHNERATKLLKKKLGLSEVEEDDSDDSLTICLSTSDTGSLLPIATDNKVDKTFAKLFNA